jgi:16S rRNA (adenine1518-N6/adenine1519-N6)-dimethyltransferase
LLPWFFPFFFAFWFIFFTRWTGATGTALLPSINYDSPKELKAFLDKRGIGMRKKFGQNFMISPHERSMLLDALELPVKAKVWEAGAGLGAMTAGLLERGADVTAFEIDPAFARALREFFESDSAGSGGSFHLVEGDILKTWRSVNVNGNELFLFGNLPYNIAAALIADFIEKGRFFKRAVITVQREVAQRMAAGPGSGDYSSFSVLCSSVYKIKLLKIIKPSSFYPAPNVDSQGVRMDLISEPEKKSRLFYPLVRSLFSSRRKTLRNTLTAFVSSVIIGSDKEVAEAALKKAGISGDRRAETLSIDEFAALAKFLEERF